MSVFLQTAQEYLLKLANGQADEVDYSTYANTYSDVACVPGK